MPSRSRFLAAKTGALALTVALLAALTAVGTVSITGPLSATRLISTALLAAAVATVLRKTVPAIAVLLGYYHVLVPFIRGPVDDIPLLPAAALLVAAVFFVRRGA